MAERWREGMRRATASLDEASREVDAFAPRWDDPSWADRVAPAVTPPAIRIGETRLELAEIPGAVSAAPRLREGIPTRFAFPTLLPFPDRSNHLIEVPSAGRSAAISVLQS